MGTMYNGCSITGKLWRWVMNGRDRDIFEKCSYPLSSGRDSEIGDNTQPSNINKGPKCFSSHPLKISPKIVP